MMRSQKDTFSREGEKAARAILPGPGLGVLPFPPQPHSEVHHDHARRNHRNPEDRNHEVSDQQRSSESPFGAPSDDREDVAPSNGCPLVRHEPILSLTGPLE